MNRPDYLSAGEHSRLFPVLSETSKEGRTTSILLSCFENVELLGKHVLATIGQKIGKRSKIATFTEPVFKGQEDSRKLRPDGLIVVENGNSSWSALVEAKVGNSALDVEQIESYRAIAKQFGLDCVITISNQFAPTPQTHPLEGVRKSRSRVPVFHWSWMSILTSVELLLAQSAVEDIEQNKLLSEMRRFLIHDSSGVKGFERMPPEWVDLNKYVSAGGRIAANSEEASCVVSAWHQETRELSLILSRLTESLVTEKIARSHRTDLSVRQKSDLQQLRSDNCLRASFDISDAAASLDLVADIPRRTLEVGMTLRAPQDKKSSRARVNWLTRQVKLYEADDVFVRLQWPGRSEDTLFPLSQLRESPEICEVEKAGLQVHSFHIFTARRLGARFTQQSNFIKELEAVVPAFYREIGQILTAWRKPAPRIKPEKTSVADLAVDEPEPLEGE